MELRAFTVRGCRALLLALCAGIRRGQVDCLGLFTSLLSMPVKLMEKYPHPAYQSYNSSWLKKQEHNNQEAINNGVQVATRKAIRIVAWRQQRELVNQAGEHEDERRAQAPSTHAVEAADDDGSDELD